MLVWIALAIAIGAAVLAAAVGIMVCRWRQQRLFASERLRCDPEATACDLRQPLHSDGAAPQSGVSPADWWQRCPPAAAAAPGQARHPRSCVVSVNDPAAADSARAPQHLGPGAAAGVASAARHPQYQAQQLAQRDFFV
eukprot:TRINITY_DN29445_c0_g1_i1.p3 TRINITY_DN29445_c0_g1~~TRINITY_DN29445_c0_g1_i1.p3  ORF type:complete len:139 (+),score=37.28 TRINITY_DN29445_c0_g1_i1:82-498(+)